MVGTNQGRFNDIGSVALDAQGNMYIVDLGNHRIQKFDPQGNFLRFYGGYANDRGTGHPGKFNQPYCVTIDSQGYLYVSDLENRRIQKLDQDGNVLLIITNTSARDIVVDSQGYIYTIDAWTFLRKFDPNGNLLWQKGYQKESGSEPDDPYCFDRPNGIALGPDGKLYVADTWQGRIKKFDTDGNGLAVYHLTDDAIFDVAFDSQGLMYISSHYYYRIAVYRFENGNPIWVRNFPAGYYGDTITLDGAGNLYITTYLDQMTKVSPNGEVLFTLGSNGKGPQEFCMPKHMTKDAQGNVYVIDPLYHWFWSCMSNWEWALGNHRIRKLDRDGNLLLTFGHNGGKDNEFFWAPNDIAVDGSGNIYLCSNNWLIDGWNGYGCIQKFDRQGNFLAKFQVTDETQPVYAMGIDPTGVLYITGKLRRTGTWYYHTRKFSPQGEFLQEIVYSRGMDGNPRDMEVDRDGNYFVLDNDTLRKFDSTGTLLFAKVGTESGIGRINGWGLDVDDQGNVWVADTYNHRILCFGNDGTFKFQFGTQGFGPGEFQLPHDVVVAGGRLFVADTYNQRIQIFDLALPPTAEAGENLTVASEAVAATVIHGTATDPGHLPLRYRWLKGEAVLLDWQEVGPSGAADLDLGAIAEPLGLGTHTLTLEVTNGYATAKDEMYLTVENSAPHAAPTGGGTIEVGSAITLGGQVSDYDGDLLSYAWKEGGAVLSSGQIWALPENVPVTLPDFTLAGLSVGTHLLTLEVSDGRHTAAGELRIDVVDTTAPRLTATADTTILWPPNHQMVQVAIHTEASDNSGGPVQLAAVVASSEPVEGLGDGDMSPDWTEPVIAPDTGIITLELRAERSGRGRGRTYVVRVTATDASGNASTTDVQILVPHDRRK